MDTERMDIAQAEGTHLVPLQSAPVIRPTATPDSGLTFGPPSGDRKVHFQPSELDGKSLRERGVCAGNRGKRRSLDGRTTLDRVKQILTPDKRPRGIQADGSWVIREKLTLDGGWTVEEASDGRTIHVLDRDGNRVGYFRTPLAHGAATSTPGA